MVDASAITNQLALLQSIYRVTIWAGERLLRPPASTRDHRL